jgi:hypothetical protein
LPVPGGEASRPAPSGAPFEVPTKPAAATAPASPAAVSATGPLERLRAGEIDLKRYLDLKVDEATTHLKALPPVELEAIRSALRDRLASDPALVDLVRTATGQAPQPPSDD